MADDCEYGTLKDELMRDRIIVGVIGDTLSDRLQAKSDLTLADAVRMSRQAEARKQNRTLGRKPSDVDYVNRTRSGNNDSSHSRNDEFKKTSLRSNNCQCCGRQGHTRQMGPAKDATCNNCHKEGHFQAVCRSTKPRPSKVNEVD